MKINRTHWILFAALAVISLLVWLRFTYPRFAFLDLSINRHTALSIAQDYLKEEEGLNPRDYKSATIFIGAKSTDAYLQNCIGFEEELKFLKEHGYELFAWRVRFYKENEKEQFFVNVSAATGEVLAFKHVMENSEARPDLGRDASKERVVRFLREKFGFNPELHDLHSDLVKNFDNRSDYTFVWEKKGVYIKWSDKENTGGGKLLIGARITGEDIVQFTKFKFEIPDQYRRAVSKKKDTGKNLAILFRIVFFSLLTASIFYVVVRRNDLVLHTTKNFCILITATLFMLHIAAYFNEFEDILFHYSTTSKFVSYLWQNISHYILDTFIVTISVLMPCLSGESLRYEVYPIKDKAGFLYYIRTSFLSREILPQVLLGYLVAIVMVGIQSSAFRFGEKYLGVWVEYIWMGQLSASYFPFLAALVLSTSASLTEEISFRLFAINLGKKYLNNTALAVLLSAVIWGFGHSTYLVFPMWFRGLEVTLLGIFLSLIYLRFGILTVIVAHFVFDTFWTSTAHLLMKSTPENFISSLIVFLLPALYGIAAYVKNNPVVLKPLEWKLSQHQKFNLEVLKHYLKSSNIIKTKPQEELKKEIVSHGWDISVVEVALKDLSEGKSHNGE